jgi:ribosomal protein S18 acetylase RimI-like enzyme
MNVGSAVTSIGRNLQTHGFRAAMYDVAVRTANTFVTWKNIQCLAVEEPDPRFMTLAPEYRYIRLDRDALFSFSDNPKYELPREFLNDALEKGDECHAILNGGVLASYGWYSVKPTLLTKDLRLHFGPQHVYMYKGLTLPAHRGQRIYSAGMTLALAHYRAAGYEGLVSCVEMNNFNALKSCYRMGYKPCGNIRFMKLGGAYLIQPDALCRQYGLELRQTSIKVP